MENKNRELASMLIKMYNAQAGTAFRTGNEYNIARVSAAIERANGNTEALRSHIRTYVAEHKNEEKDLWACFDAFRGVAEATTAVPETTTEPQVNGAMDILGKAMIEILAKTQADKIEAEIKSGIEAQIRDFIKSEYGVIERKIVTVVDGKRKQMDGVAHEKLDTVIQYVANDEPVYLTGPAGSGKNELCKQVAKALDLDFYFTNAVTQEYQLKGFTDAMGNYQPTQFYKAFTEGGLFMLDEMDASIPEVLVILNSALANRYFDFPAPIGFKRAHPNFRVVAAGNTLGHGADFNYVGRVQLDGASLDRFAVVPINYSPAIESMMANGDNELLAFCREYRKSADASGLNIIVSYRAIRRMAKMSQIMDLEEVIETGLTRGLEKDDICHILDGIHVSNKWVDALRKLTK